MDGDVLLKARGLSKSFGAVRVLHDVSFDVVPGEVLGILGPNGAGKTTLFNLISGDLKRDGGELVFAGRRCAASRRTAAARWGSGAPIRCPDPMHGMTTFENLLVAAAFGGGRSETASYAFCAQILRDCELSDKANRIGRRADAARPQAAGTGPRARLRPEASASRRDRRRADRRGRQGAGRRWSAASATAASRSCGSSMCCMRCSRWRTGSWC